MTVLMLGTHAELESYRAEYLRGYGYAVMFPESKQEAVRAVNTGAYDVVILSYALSHDMVMELHELIDQSHSHCPIIALTEQRRPDSKINSDKVVLVSEGPEALLRAVKDIEQRKRRVK